MNSWIPFSRIEGVKRTSFDRVLLLWEDNNYPNARKISIAAFRPDGCLRKSDLKEFKNSKVIAYYYPNRMTYCHVKFMANPDNPWGGLPQDLTECREALCLFGWGDTCFDLEIKPCTIKDGRILYTPFCESRHYPEYLIGYCKLPDIYEFEVNE